MKWNPIFFASSTERSYVGDLKENIPDVCLWGQIMLAHLIRRKVHMCECGNEELHS